MKNRIKLFGIIALLAVIVLSLISCDERPKAEIKITNDKSRAYTIRVKIDGETVYDGEIEAGFTRSHSRGSGFSYRVYVSNTSYVLEAFNTYFYGDVSPGDVDEMKISEIYP